MVKKKIDKKKVKNQAGLAIMIICMVVLTFLLTGFFIKFSNLNVNSDESADILGSSLKAEISNIADIDTDKVFADTYNSTQFVLSSSVAYGTTWLNICPNSQEIINDVVYFRACDDNFSSVKDIKEKLMTVVTEDYADELIGNEYMDKDGYLYFTPVVVEKDPNYVERISYNVKSVTTSKIIYMVKSKYKELGCESDCEYTYKEHKFILEYVDGKWLTSSIEMPY